MKVSKNEIKDFVISHSQNIYPSYAIEPGLQVFNRKELYRIWLSLVYSKIHCNSKNERIVYDLCLQHVGDVINEKKKE